MFLASPRGEQYPLQPVSLTSLLCQQSLLELACGQGWVSLSAWAGSSPAGSSSNLPFWGNQRLILVIPGATSLLLLLTFRFRLFLIRMSPGYKRVYLPQSKPFVSSELLICFWTVVLEKTLESPLDCREIQPVHSKGDQPWLFFGRNDAKAETLVLWPPHAKSWLIGKDRDAGRDWG